MRDYIISTETSADLTWEFALKREIHLFPMYYFMDNKDYEGTREDSLTGTAFYQKMRNGAMPTTAMVTQTHAENYFEKFLKEDLDILHIAFSSGLSASCDSFKNAAKYLNTKYKEERIVVIDSLSGCSGEGLLAYIASKIKEKGADFSEAVSFVTNKVQRICHYFTVDDLYHLYRGGRISRTKAAMGSLFKLKPILCLDNSGKIATLFNAHGREKSLLALVEKFGQKHLKGENDLIFIGHGDALEEATFVKNEIKRRYGYRDFEINFVGPIVGAHAGPGSVALFFLGDNRVDM